MKKIFYSLIIPAFALAACGGGNSGSSNEAVGDTIDAYRHVGVENVNGNIPDTTDAIDLSTDRDSSEIRDSMP